MALESTTTARRERRPPVTRFLDTTPGQTTWAGCNPRHGRANVFVSRQCAIAYRTPFTGQRTTANRIGTVDACPENAVVRSKAQRRLGRSVALP